MAAELPQFLLEEPLPDAAEPLLDAPLAGESSAVEEDGFFEPQDLAEPLLLEPEEDEGAPVDDLLVPQDLEPLPLELGRLELELGRLELGRLALGRLEPKLPPVRLLVLEAAKAEVMPRRAIPAKTISKTDFLNVITWHLSSIESG